MLKKIRNYRSHFGHSLKVNYHPTAIASDHSCRLLRLITGILRYIGLVVAVVQYNPASTGLGMRNSRNSKIHLLTIA